MPGTWPRPSSATSRSSRPSICPSIDPQSTPSFTSSRPSPPIRSTRSSPSSIFSPAISSKQQPEKTPYRGYDIADDSGCVSVGVTHDTAQFAVNAIRTWLEKMGHERYPAAGRLMITADCGGSNGARVRLWKLELQKLADETGLTLCVCHYPPGTSKWNRIEHRLFAHISQNWRARPLTSHLAIVELIAATTTNTGLTVACELDTTTYPKGIKVSDAEMATLNISGDAFHPEWNYTIASRTPNRALVLRLLLKPLDLSGSCHPLKAAAFRRWLLRLPVDLAIPPRVTRPLRSTGITRLHHYYGAVRTWPAPWYSRGVATCAFSLAIADLKFRAKARIR